MNDKYHTTDIDTLDESVFFNAIKDAIDGGVTSAAPLGYSGQDFLLHGKSFRGRESVVSIRMHSGTIELLVTDIRGRFLVYNRLNIDLPIGYIAKEHYRSFNLVKHIIKTKLKKTATSINLDIDYLNKKPSLPY